MSEDRAPVAYEHRQLHCRQCGQVLMLTLNVTAWERQSARYVTTHAEVIAGANVTCGCGTVSFCQPMIPARTVK